jgi:hypothetical protein
LLPFSCQNYSEKAQKIPFIRRKINPESGFKKPGFRTRTRIPKSNPDKSRTRSPGFIRVRELSGTPEKPGFRTRIRDLSGPDPGPGPISNIYVPMKQIFIIIVPIPL